MKSYKLVTGCIPYQYDGMLLEQKLLQAYKFLFWTKSKGMLQKLDRRVSFQIVSYIVFSDNFLVLIWYVSRPDSWNF